MAASRGREDIQQVVRNREGIVQVQVVESLQVLAEGKVGRHLLDLLEILAEGREGSLLLEGTVLSSCELSRSRPYCNLR
jgi:hypothetical protein